MEFSDQFARNRFSYRWINFAATGLLAAVLAGCGGSGGSGDTTAAAPAAGAGATAPTVTAPTGTAPITLTASTPAATLAALTPTVTVGGVSISSPPVVTFAVSDGASTNNAIIGLGYTRAGDKCTTSSRSTNVSMVPMLTNMSFSLAKLVPGTNGSPSKWVSYIVASPEVYTSATDKTVIPRAPTRPSTENNGTIKDNGNGTYTYTFFNDITKMKDLVATLTDAAGADKADLGDLTYDPTLTHRLTIQISGDVFGTGSVTADCSSSGVTAVPMANPVNVIYDFIPATGKAVTATDASRDIVATAKCKECHDKLGGIPGETKMIASQDLSTRVLASAGFHGGARNDARYCVVCHTDQRKYGQARATSTDNAFPALTRKVTTSATTGLSSASLSPSTYVADGVTVGDFPVLIHKIHMGEELVKKNYNFANVPLNETRYPQTITNCAKCHDGSDTSSAKTANGNNWMSVASRLACGACHDGINFANNTGLNLADAAAGKTSSSIAHIGGAKADDSQCAICHGVAEIPVYHATVSRSWDATFTTLTQVAGQKSLPAGAAKFAYEISSVTVSGTPQRASVKFRILKDGTPVTFNTFATGGTALLTGFTGGPSIYVAMAIPQDGITAPADFNKYISASVLNLWNGTAGTLSARDADGYYTAVLGDGLAGTTYDIPTSAVMVTGLMGYASFTQTMSDTIAYPTGLQVPGQAVQKVATGHTPRRDIVSNAKCNACHEQINLFTAARVHGGSRNDASGCAICHNPNRTSNGWSGDSSSFYHAIHAASKRTVNFTRNSTYRFWEVGYPGVLKNCETCHVAGSYDFSATANANAVSKRLYRTVVTGITATASSSTSPYVVLGTNYGSGYSTSTGIGTAGAGGVADNLVNSPIANACFSCHDSDEAKTHMNSDGGGSIYQPRTVALARTENCLFCHGSGKLVDIKVMHAK